MQRGDRSASGQPSPGSNGNSLDDASLTTINGLLRLSNEFRQSISQVRRIQGGSPGAGTLGPAVAGFNIKISTKAPDCQQVFIKCSQVPGIKVLEAKFKEFQDTLNEPFDDRSTGYYQRVCVLEKLNYTNGKLCGAIEVIIEHHDHWKMRLTGQHPQPLNRRLNFDMASSPSQTTTTFGGGRGVQQGGRGVSGGGVQLRPAGLRGGGDMLGQQGHNVGGVGGGGRVCDQLSALAMQLSQAPILNFGQTSPGQVSIPTSLSGQSQPQSLHPILQVNSV